MSLPNYGRDRFAARTTVGGEFPARALSIGEVGASFHPGPRFRRPPCDPGRWAFPRPVLTVASRRSPSHIARSFSADSHTPLRGMVCFHGRSIVPRPYTVRVLLEPPSAQSPCARPRCDPHATWCPAPCQRALPHLPRSYGLMRQSSPLLVPRWYPQHQVCAGCGQPRLGAGPSRRSLCASVPTCVDPSPGGS